jgi:DNA-binding transcriptional LysR family regulator
MIGTIQLQQFCTVVECGTVAKAAELLEMTPGALSRALQRTERDLSFRLFRPQGRNIVPTQQGMLLYGKARLWLESIDRGLRDIREQKPDFPPVRVATFEVFSSHVLAWIIDAGFEHTPFVAQECVPGILEAAVAGNRCDWGLTYLPIPMQGVEFQKVCTFRFRVFARVGSFTGQEANSVPFAVPTTPLGVNLAQVGSLDTWPHTWARWEKHRFELLETALALARRGKCAIFIPDFLATVANQSARSDQQLGEFCPASGSLKGPPRSVFLVTRSGEPETPEVRRVAKLLRQLCNGFR